MSNYKSKIYERRCFAVFTERMLELMEDKHNNTDLKMRITIDPLEICIYDNQGELRYDEDHMIDNMNNKLKNI